MPTHDPRTTRPDEDGVSELLARALDQAREIARTEAELMRAEAARRARALRMAVALLALAIVIGIGAIVPLVSSAVLGLQWAGLAPGPAYLVAGSVLAILAIVAALVAASLARRAGRPPREIVENLSADVQTLKETLK